MRILFTLLNYFWLSPDPKLNAKWYCDQHCFKIHTELISSVWDAVSEIAPWLCEEADEAKIPNSYRGRIHARPGSKWHPLSAWNGLCLENCLTSLECARALLEEHESRTGCHHKVWKDYEFLVEKIGEVSFTSGMWVKWFESQFPGKKKEDVLKPFAKVPGSPRDLGYMTEPPRCIDLKNSFFKECKSSGHSFDDLVKVYRKYYEAKTLTIKGGMRYYYSPVPKWLKGEVRVERKGR